MKTQKNWQKVSSVVLGLMAAGFMVVLAGCPSPLESSGTTGGDVPVMAAGQGVVRVSLGEVNAARTLMPVEGTPAFTKYELTFTNGSVVIPVVRVVDPVAGGVIDPTGVAGANAGDPIEVALEQGNGWKLELTAFTTPSGHEGYYPAAYGTVASFDVASGVVTPVTINITPITSGDLWDEANNGIFKYAISYPATNVTGTISLVPTSGTGMGTTVEQPNGGVLSVGGTAIGSMKLAPGTYSLRVSLWKNEGITGDQAYQPFAGTYTEVHIYPGLVTEATGLAFTFADDDFVDLVYLAGKVDLSLPSGSTTLLVKEVTVKAYSNAAFTNLIPNGEVTISYPFGTSVPSVTTVPVPWFLSIPLSATANGVYLTVTVTDGNGHSFTKSFAYQHPVVRKGDDNIQLDPTASGSQNLLELNLAGVTVTFDGMPTDDTVELTTEEDGMITRPSNLLFWNDGLLFWQDNTPLLITVPTDFTVNDWLRDGEVIGGTALSLTQYATDFSSGRHTITASVTKAAAPNAGKIYSKTVNFTVEDKVRFASVDEFKGWIDTKTDPRTKTTPYAVKLLDIDLANEYVALLDAIGDHYVALDLSGAGGTTLPAIDTNLHNKDKIVSVILSDLLTGIGANAFKDCTALTTINLPDLVTSIGDNAFEGCTALATIDLPATLATIGDNAFQGCIKLAAINDLPTTLASIGEYAFQGCTSLVTIASSPGTIVMPASLESIGKFAFEGCTSLAAINLPALPVSLNNIGESMFEGCVKLATIYLPASLTGIGDNAFKGCTSLVTIGLPTTSGPITLPTSLTAIGESAFEGCTKLGAIDWSTTATATIGAKAFKGCSSLVAIGLPATLQSIGVSAFEGCVKLVSINLPDRPNLPDLMTTISDRVFYGCVALTAIRLPDALETIGESAFDGCAALAAIAFPATLTGIGDSAFDGCAALVTIDLPATLTGIGATAFKDCVKLATVTLTRTDASLTTLGLNAFEDCTKLTRIYVPADRVSDYKGATNWSTYTAKILSKS